MSTRRSALAKSAPMKSVVKAGDVLAFATRRLDGEARPEK
jgi:hypothetical protein